jgi:hypothetical protein
MSSFTDKFIADTYDGLLHSDVALVNTSLSPIFDGVGNKSSLSLGTENNGAKITGPFNATSASIDLNLNVGGSVTSTTVQTYAVNATSVKTTDLEIINNFTAANVTYPTSPLPTSVFSLIYPIGSIYLSAINSDPASLFPGTIWVRISEGRFLVGVGSGNDGTRIKSFASGNNSGEYDHQLSEGEMPSHTHSLQHPDGEQFYLTNDGNDGEPNGDGRFRSDGPDKERDGRYNSNLQPTGGNIAHNNTPPGFGVYVWKRTV